MSSPDKRSDSYLHSVRSWLSLPLIAWLISIPCLGPGSVFVPIVIANAPLGIIAYFEKIHVSPSPDQATIIVIIHAVFWTLFVTGISLRRLLPLKWLRVIWFVIVAALFMSVSGCAVQLGPGLYNSGNWH